MKCFVTSRSLVLLFSGPCVIVLLCNAKSLRIELCSNRGCFLLLCCITVNYISPIASRLFDYHSVFGQELQILAIRNSSLAKRDSQVLALHALKQEKGAQTAKMAPTPIPSPDEAERSSFEKISRMCQNLRQRTKKTLKASARFLLRAFSGGEARVLEKISKTLQEYIDDVTQPMYHQALMKIFDVDHGIKLTKCICLGLGNFNIVAGKEDGSQSLHEPWISSPSELRTSLHQLAVLIVMLQFLAEGHSIQEVYFQDPAFTKVEKRFLQSLGYTVLEDPAAFAKMSASTFLFAPFVPYDVAFSAFSVSFPALYIGTKPPKNLASFQLPGEGHADEIVAIFDRFEDAAVDEEPLPVFEQRSWTKDTVVCWLSPLSIKRPEKKA